MLKREANLLDRGMPEGHFGGLIQHAAYSIGGLHYLTLRRSCTSVSQILSTALIFKCHHPKPVRCSLVCRFGRDVATECGVLTQSMNFTVHSKQQFLDGPVPAFD
jgi:hypothetical protein